VAVAGSSWGSRGGGRAGQPINSLSCDGDRTAGGRGDDGVNKSGKKGEEEREGDRERRSVVAARQRARAGGKKT
jgi:hypothetical protein